MQAIQTRYFGPTNSKGSRIQARCDAKTIYMTYDHALDIEANHRKAAQLLFFSLGWTTDSNGLNEFITGSLPDGSMAHVITRR